MTPSAPVENAKFWGSGESMVARLKLEGMNERAPPRVASVALFDTTRKKVIRFRHSKVDRLIALSRSVSVCKERVEDEKRQR